MTYQAWTKIVITSLLILSDGAIASKVNNRSDVAAVVIDSAVEISLAEIQDDSDASEQPLYTVDKVKQSKPNTGYQTLKTLIDSNAISSKYKPYLSRAPPTSF